MSVAKSQKHLANIERKAGKAIAIIQKGNDLKFGDAVKLGRKSNAIVSQMKKAMSEYDGSDPTPKEAQEILTTMDRVMGLAEKQLTLLVQTKGRLEELHVGGMVKRNVFRTDQASKELADLMISKAPADIKPKAEELEARRAKAFSTACNAFAASQGGEDQAEGEEDSD